MANAGAPIPIEYMLGCPLEALSNLQLQGLCEAANARKQIEELETLARNAELQAETARFMMQHRDLIKSAALKGTDVVQQYLQAEKEEERRERRRLRRRQRGGEQRQGIPHGHRKAAK